MPELLCVHAVGTRVGIELDGADDDTVRAVRRAWADAIEPGDAPPDTTVRLRETTIDRALESLSQQVTMAALEAGRGHVWMLHAAGIAGDDGAVVVLVGPSGRGKTTASRTLAREFGYVSDETIAIERTGAVRAYRKPLSVIEAHGLPKVQVAPSEAGLKPLPAAALRVRAVVLLDRDPAHEGAPTLVPVDLGEALAELVAQSSFLVHADAPLQLMAAIAAATGGVRRLAYAEAADLVPVVARLLAPGSTPARIPPVGGERVAATGDDDTTPRAAAGDEPRFSRAPALDHVVLPEPDRIAILTADEAGRGTLHVVAGVAPAVWRSADAATLDRLADAAVAAYGAPGDRDPRIATLVAVSALIDAGLLLSDEPLVRLRDADAPIDAAAPSRLDAEAAAAVWERLRTPTTLTQLAARAAESSGAVDPAVTTAVAAHVADLVAAGLVEEARETDRAALEPGG